eukprot:752602-Hanusia_phi.AAC.4
MRRSKRPGISERTTTVGQGGVRRAVGSPDAELVDLMDLTGRAGEAQEASETKPVDDVVISGGGEELAERRRKGFGDDNRRRKIHRHQSRPQLLIGEPVLVPSCQLLPGVGYVMFHADQTVLRRKSEKKVREESQRRKSEKKV